MNKTRKKKHSHLYVPYFFYWAQTSSENEFIGSLLLAVIATEL